MGTCFAFYITNHKSFQFYICMTKRQEFNRFSRLPHCEQFLKIILFNEILNKIFIIK